VKGESPRVPTGAVSGRKNLTKIFIEYDWRVLLQTGNSVVG